MFEAKTQESIQSELKTIYEKELNGQVSTIEGTFIGDNLAANAVEFEKSYAEMSLIVDAAFAQTSWGAVFNNEGRRIWH